MHLLMVKLSPMSPKPATSNVENVAVAQQQHGVTSCSRFSAAVGATGSANVATCVTLLRICGICGICGELTNATSCTKAPRCTWQWSHDCLKRAYLAYRGGAGICWNVLEYVV